MPHSGVQPIFAIFSAMFWEVDCKIKQNDAREGKNVQISAKIHQNDAKLCKSKPISVIKHLFCLKMVKIDVSTYKSAVLGCAWKHPEWILNVFVQFDEGLDDL